MTTPIVPPPVWSPSLLGGLGIHKFLMGKTGPGLVMLLVSLFGGVFFFIPSLVMLMIFLVEGIHDLVISDSEFHRKYDTNGQNWLPPMSQSVFVRVDSDVFGPLTPGKAKALVRSHPEALISRKRDGPFKPPVSAGRVKPQKLPELVSFEPSEELSPDWWEDDDILPATELQDPEIPVLETAPERVESLPTKKRERFFVSDLWSFEKLITTRVVGGIWKTLIAFDLFVVVGVTIAATIGSAGRALPFLPLFYLFVLLLMILRRVFFEFVLVVFRIYEVLVELRDLGKRTP